MNDVDLLRLAEQAGFSIIDGQICAAEIDGECTLEVGRLVSLLQPKTVAIECTRPVDRYIILYAEAEELLTCISARHDVNYDIEPSTVSWPDVGTMGHFVEILQYALQSMPKKTP